MGIALGRAAVEGRFVGRSEELRELIALFDETRSDGRPRFVVVEGAPGIGKSRLLREFVAAARSAAPAGAVLYGRCPATGRGLTNWALAEILRRVCGIGLDDTAEVVRERFHRGIGHVLAALPVSTVDNEETIFALSTSAGIVMPGNPFDRLEPRMVPLVVSRAWRQFLEAYARRGGAVLAIEDLHWAGSGVLDVLTGIAPTLQGPVFVIATARPAFHESNPAFLAEQDGRWIKVPPLSAMEADDLVGGLLSEVNIQSEAHAAIVARAEGNPYFLEESVQHMIESGALVWDGTSWRDAGLGQSVALPDSIQWVLAARIESLPVAERRLLQEAAVVGRVFWEGPLRSNLADANMTEHLRRLGERGLVVTRPASTLSGQVEFTFKHALLRDAVYETMTAAHRAHSHAAVGAWFAKLAGERSDELGELIAEHLRLAIEVDPSGQAWADDPAEGEAIRQEAIRYLISAGAAAHQRFAIDKAVELHLAAVRLATSDRDRARALAALGQDYESGLRGPEALDAYRRSIDAAERAGLPDGERARVHVGAARLLTLRWGAFPGRPDPADIDTLVEAGLRLADDAETRCWLLAFKGGAALRWRSTDRADPLSLDERLQATTAALDGGRDLGLPDLSATAARLQAQLEFRDGRFADARATMRKILPDIEQIGPMFLRALTSAYAVLSLTDLEGAYAEALPYANRTLELGRRLSPHEHMHGTFMTLWCLYHLGEWGGVASLVDEHVEALRGQDAFVCPYMRGGPLIGALAFGHLGKHDEARRLAALVEQCPDEPGLPEALLARVKVATGDAAGGAEIARRLLATGREASFEENEHESLALVEALLALEDWDGLRSLLPDARRRSAGLPILEPICDRAEAMAAAADGDTAAAVALLQSASSWFERHGVRYEHVRTQALLAGVVPDGADILADALETAESLFGDSTTAHDVVTPTRPAPDALSALTGRELEVLRLVAAGQSNVEIGATLFLSLRTVERHLSNIYLKLGLSGRTARVTAVAALAQREPPATLPRT